MLSSAFKKIGSLFAAYNRFFVAVNNLTFALTFKNKSFFCVDRMFYCHKENAFYTPGRVFQQIGTENGNNLHFLFLNK